MLMGETTFEGRAVFRYGVSGLNLEIGNISGLRNQLDSLQSQLSSLQGEFYNHKHTVTIPPHNHGNPANVPNTGGGTFSTSTP
ncbi:hypothetical protein D3C76_1357990 [compost metagenome]